MARSAVHQYVEVPIAEESVHGDWQQIDYCRERYVEDDDFRSRKTVSSACQLKLRAGSHVLCWRVRVHEGRECLDLSEWALDEPCTGENFRLYFEDPVVYVNFFYSENQHAVILLVVLSSGVRMALLPAVLDGNQPNAQWVISSLNADVARLSLGQALESLQIREGISLTCSDALCIKSDGEDSVSMLVGTSTSTVYRAKIFFDDRSVVWSEASVSNWISSIFRSPAKSSTAHDRLCSVLHGNHPDVWYSLSEDGKLRKWQSGKAASERLVKMEKIISGVKHAFLAFDMTLINDAEQDFLVFCLQAEHASVSLMAWCSCKDHVIYELDGDITSLVADRLKELGDSIGVQKIKSIKKVLIDGEDEIVSVWHGYDTQVISLSRFRGNVWGHGLIHTVSSEISSAVEVAKLHIDCMQKNSGLSDSRIWNSMIDTETYLENLVFRPRWFHRALIITSANELLLSKGLPSEILPDQSSHVQVKAHVRKIVDTLARSGGPILEIKSSLWWDLFRLCFSKWRAHVDEYLGLGIVENRVFLVKKSAISYLRHQHPVEQNFFGSSAEPTGDELFRVAYNCLIWAQDADPGGVRFSWEMNRVDSKTALRSLLTSSLMNIAHLPSDCDPDIFLKIPARLNEHKNKMRGFFTTCTQFLDAMFVKRDEWQWGAAAKEYAASQQMYVYLEVLRGVGLFLSMLIHFDTSGSSSVAECIGAELDTCCRLLKVFHVLRWCCTRGDPSAFLGFWTAEKSLLSLANSFPQNLSTSMEDLNLVPGRASRKIVHNLVFMLFGQLCSGKVESNLGDDLWKEPSLWKELLNLIHIICVHENDKTDKLNDGVAALMQGICCIHLSSFQLAEKYLNTVLDASRNSVMILQEFVDKYLFPEVERTKRNMRDEFCSSVGPNDTEFLNLFDLFFTLHDDKFGIFTRISAFVDRSGSQYEPSKNRLRLIELTSLQKLAALITSLRKPSQFHIASDALSMLTDLAYNDALLRVANYYCMSASLSDMDTPFDLSYSLMADRIKDCCDHDVEKLRKHYEADTELKMPYVDRIWEWCSALQGSGSDDGDETERVHAFLSIRRKQNAYLLLSTFVEKLHSRRLLHRVCAYPWVGCSQTVDSYLKKLCDVPGQDQIDAAYRARYAFNISRSDYKTAGETMGTLCFNLSSRVDENSSRVMVPALRKQADVCLAAVNAYSLIDEQFAFFKPPNAGSHVHQRTKRQVDTSEDSSEGRPKHFKTDTSTMGWQVTTAPDSLDTSVSRAEGNARSQSVIGAITFRYSSGEASNISQNEKIVTLGMLRKHYYLLRSRIKLAERLQFGGAGGGSCKPVPLFQQDLLAWETVRELVEASLSDDAISLAIAYQMDLSILAVLLTRGCIETTDAASHAQVYTTSSFSAEEKSNHDLSCHEAWSTLQAQLAFLDDYRRSCAVCGVAGYRGGVADVPTLIAAGLQNIRADGTAVQLSSLFGVAASVILQHSTSPALPPWLYKALKEGVEGAGLAGSGDGFWTGHGDAGGLARLLLRCGRLEAAGQLLIECLEPPFGPAAGPGSSEDMHLRRARYVPWNQVGCVVRALSTDASLKAPYEQLQAALERRLACAERETHFLDAWYRAVVMQGPRWLEDDIQQAWRDLGRGAMTCRAGESGWWECLSVLRADESVWQQLCVKVWERVLNSDAQVVISAACDHVQGQNLSSQMLARIVALSP